jgi:MFS family permease
MAILSSLKSEDREKYIGWLEALSGLGLLFGPILGAILFNLGNFSSPFWFQATLFLVSYPWIYSSLLSSSVQDSDGFVEVVSKLPQVPLSELLCIPRFVFGMASQMNLMMTIQYLAPTMAIHLQEYGFSQTAIGLSYGIPAILYAMTAPFVYRLCQRMEKRGVVLIGFVTISVAMLMVGGQPNSVFIGLCLLGLSIGLVTIPVLPEMLESVETN